MRVRMSGGNSNKGSKSVPKEKGSGGGKGAVKAELEQVNRDLLLRANDSGLLEQKLQLLFKLKQYPQLVEEGYRVLGKKGPSTHIYKSIILGLARQSKFDEIYELLEQWKKSGHAAPEMQETKRKLDSLFTKIKSGLDASKLLTNLEDLLSVQQGGGNSGEKDLSSSSEWKHRPPPKGHSTFSLCPRVLDGASPSKCLYGQACLSAHSKEELKEWITRAKQEPMVVVKKEEKVQDALFSPIPKEEIPISYRGLPPACMYYIANLSKRLKEVKNLKTLFVENLPDVKIQLTTPSIMGKKLPIYSPGQVTLSHKWSFMVAAKRPLATVTLLHDATRERFALSGALFFNSKKASINLIDLHPNNKSQKGIQVLNTFIRPELFLPFNNGWPDWCCYQIDVTFQLSTRMPGRYEQDVVFDFKGDPKVIKRLGVWVEQRAEKEQTVVENNKPQPLERDFRSTLLLNIKDKSGSGGKDSSPSLASSFSQESLLSDSENEEELKPSLNNLSPSKSSLNLLEGPPEGIPNLLNFSTSLVQLLEDLGSETLTRENYVSWMNRFLTCEMKAREHEFLTLSLKTDVSIFKGGGGELCGRLFLIKDVNDTSKLGRLFLKSCSKISLSVDSSPASVIAKPRSFICPILGKGEKDGQVIIRIRKEAAQELQLLPDSIRKLSIWLHLDSGDLEVLKGGLDLLLRPERGHVYSLLFPPLGEGSREDGVWDFNSILYQPSITQNYELSESLNCKQKDALHAILCDEGPVSVPVIITGPPKSGKSFVIGESVKSLFTGRAVKSLSRILICTFTNEAADDLILTHFNDDVFKKSQLLRIYDTASDPETVSDDVKQHCLLINDKSKSTFRFPSMDDILASKVIVTNFSCCGKLLQLGLPQDLFSHIFLDEAHRFLEPESLLFLLLSGPETRLVLSGDLEFLTPETFLPRSQSLDPSVSLLARLDALYPPRHPKRVRLEETYDQNGDILNFISNEFYGSSLKIAVGRAEKSKKGHPKYHPLSLQFVQDGEERIPDHGGGFYNMKEIHAVRDKVYELLRAWPSAWGNVREGGIAVITPYPDQAVGLRIQLRLGGLDFVHVKALSNGLDRQYRVVLLSPVRTFKGRVEEGEVKEADFGGFYTDRRALYSAMTRALSLLIVVGDVSSLCNVGICKDIWRQYVRICKQNNSLFGLPIPVQGERTKGVAVTEVIKPKPRLPSPITRPSSLFLNSKPETSYALSRKAEMEQETPSALVKPFSLFASTPLSPPSSDSLMDSKLRGVSSIWEDSHSSSNHTQHVSNHTNRHHNGSGVKSGGQSLSEHSSIWGPLPIPQKREKEEEEEEDESPWWTVNSDDGFKSPFDLPDVRLLAEASLPQPSNEGLNTLSALGLNSSSSNQFLNKAAKGSSSTFELAQSCYTYFGGEGGRPVMQTSRPVGGMTSNPNLDSPDGKNFEFIKELGLLSIGGENGRKSSSASIASDKLCLEDAVEFPGLEGAGKGRAAADWVEVKGSKKRENKVPTAKRKEKGESNGGILSPESARVMKELKEMGFREQDILKALNVSDHDLERSIEWLIHNSNSAL